MPKTKEPDVTPEEVYGVVRRLMEKNGRSPTFREIAKTIKRSLCCVQLHLSRLRQAGLVDWDENTPRSLSLTGYEFKLVKKGEST